MIQLLPHDKTLKIVGSQPCETVASINDYIDNHFCENMSVDISSMNILDACYVSTVCSANHYVKYPNGKIKWKISSALVKEFTSRLELGNADYEIF